MLMTFQLILGWAACVYLRGFMFDYSMEPREKTASTALGSRREGGREEGKRERGR